MSSPPPPNHHLAAILPSKAAGVLQLSHRPTPTPGPHDLLIAVHSIALNPVDFNQRDAGFPPIKTYPTVIGSDISGTVLATGSSVSSQAPKPGTRIAAFAPSFYKGLPDYGAFQTRVLVPSANAVVLPPTITFNQGAILPVAISTAWAALHTMGVARDTAHSASDKKGMLIWGGASSIGSAAVQIAARTMGFHVYATASPKHHAYLQSLGASKVFDYKQEDVVEKIVTAVKADGFTVSVGFDAAVQLKPCLDVLGACKAPEGTAILASARQVPEDAARVEGVEARFVMAPVDEGERTERFGFVFGGWLEGKLGRGEFVPSPGVKVVEGGLESINKGLDELRGGVSGVKLVLEV